MGTNASTGRRLSDVTDGVQQQQVKVVEADVDGLLRSCEHLYDALQRVLVKTKVTPERYSELVQTVDVMAATTVSRDYVDGLATTVGGVADKLDCLTRRVQTLEAAMRALLTAVKQGSLDDVIKRLAFIKRHHVRVQHDYDKLQRAVTSSNNNDVINGYGSHALPSTAPRATSRQFPENERRRGESRASQLSRGQGQGLGRIRANFVSSVTVAELGDSEVHVLSVQAGRMVVGGWLSRHLYVYSTDGRHVTTVGVHEAFWDAAWASVSGGGGAASDLVCTTAESHKVLLVACGGGGGGGREGGVSVRHTHPMAYPRCVTVSSDDVIYVADWQSGVSRSADGGATWSHVFRAPDGWRCRHVIKVGGLDDIDGQFLCTEWQDGQYRVRIYCVSMRRGAGLAWRDVRLQTARGRLVDIDACRIAYDADSKNVFVADGGGDGCVHVFAVTMDTSGGGGRGGDTECDVTLTYRGVLLSPEDGLRKPCQLAVDRQHRLLYVGQVAGEVTSYTLPSAFYRSSHVTTTLVFDWMLILDN